MKPFRLISVPSHIIAYPRFYHAETRSIIRPSHCCYPGFRSRAVVFNETLRAKAQGSEIVVRNGLNESTNTPKVLGKALVAVVRRTTSYSRRPLHSGIFPYWPSSEVWRKFSVFPDSSSTDSRSVVSMMGDPGYAHIESAAPNATPVRLPEFHCSFPLWIKVRSDSSVAGASTTSSSRKDSEVNRCHTPHGGSPLLLDAPYAICKCCKQSDTVARSPPKASRIQYSTVDDSHASATSPVSDGTRTVSFGDLTAGTAIGGLNKRASLMSSSNRYDLPCRTSPRSSESARSPGSTIRCHSISLPARHSTDLFRSSQRTAYQSRPAARSDFTPFDTSDGRTRCTFATFRHNVCTDDWIAFPGIERKHRPQQLKRNARVPEANPTDMASMDAEAIAAALANETTTTTRYEANCTFCKGNEDSLPKVLQSYTSDDFIKKWPLVDQPISCDVDKYNLNRNKADVAVAIESPNKRTESEIKGETEIPRTGMVPNINDEVNAALRSSASALDISMLVVPNKYPVVAPSSCLISPNDYPFIAEEASVPSCSLMADSFAAAKNNNSHINTSMAATGFHEVVVDHSYHNAKLSDLNNVYWHMLFTAFRDRCAVMANGAPLLQTVLCFKNQGAFGGASMHHPHSQLVGLPVVPQSQVKFHQHARRYFADHGHCLFCKYISNEINSKCRIVEESDLYVALVPYGAHIPYHITVFPKVHNHQFILETDESLYALGLILDRTFKRLDLLFHNPDFNLVLRNAHLHRGKFQLYRPEAYYHWHVEIFPRLDSWPVAGFEFGSGIMCNSHFPEEDAEALRSCRLSTTRLW